MCSIFGHLTSSNNPHHPCESALQTLVHRGPDEQGVWHGQQIFLGMCRLSIIDLATGQQPIWNEDDTLGIIYNGELYNFHDLRPKLESLGHIFRTCSDTEVILHAYEEWGADCLRLLNGMFAFAIWNTVTEELFIARDRIGEKPLYYYQDTHRFIFASEIKAIVADETVQRQLNWRGAANFFAFGHAVAPETIYEGIYKLLPGHYMKVHHGRLTTEKYWDVGYDVPENLHTAKNYASDILALLDDSVRRRMIADVPLGAFLSGGVDSSAVVALMKRHASDPVKTFSLGFAIGGDYNELSDARRVAEYLGTEHYELQVESIDLVQTLRRLVYHYDEPFGDAAGFPVYLLSQFAKQYVKVVLSGDGGDELFGGYRRYAADQLSPFYQRLPSFLTQRWLPQIADKLPRLRRLKRALNTLPIDDPAYRYASWLRLFSRDMQAELLNQEFFTQVADHDPAWPYPLHYSSLSNKVADDHLNRLMYVDLKTWLVDVYMEKTDKATMAASLEARLPLLDYRLVELAFQIPGKYKVRGWSTKQILRQAVSGLVPPFVLKKPKHGFAVPTDPWFRGELKEYTFDILLGNKARSRGYFNMSFIERLWREHANGQHIWDTHLWLLLNFELWHRIYLDGEGI
jgi:asparagine synthase (glutamine-hydrolysing)